MDYASIMIVFKLWHNFLDMPRKDEEWHRNDIADELAEYEEAEGFIDRWSELSDVVYAVTRARWDGFESSFPLSLMQVLSGIAYMFPKYTSRWLFYYVAGRKAGAGRKVTEVRNPVKVHKLHHIAKKYDIEPELFAGICERQLKYWPLLK